MKVKLLCSCILITCLQSFGQYIPVCDTGNIWSINNNYTAGGIPAHSHYIKFESDTLINSKLYRIALKTNDTLPNPLWTRIGYIYEDISSKKVYFMNYQFNEGLLYDFSLDTGDTAIITNTYWPGNSGTIWVTKTDSVFIGNQFIKQIHLSTTSIKWFPGDTLAEIWIEGIGSLKGVIYSNYHVLGASMELLCFYNNDVMLYQNPGFQSCFFPLGINSLQKYKPCIKIWPNPVTRNSIVHFELHNSKKFKTLNVNIYNTSGQIVKSFKDVDNTITINDILPGIYFVKFFNKEFIRNEILIVI